MSLRIIKIIMALSVLMQYSCSNSLPANDYIKWVNNPENGLLQTIVKGDYTYEIHYLPTDYLGLNELRNQVPTDSLFDANRKQYDSLNIFVIKIYPSDKKSEFLKYKLKNDQEYYDRVRYYSSIFNTHLELIENKDTFPCRLSHFEQNYQITPYIKIMVEFESKNKICDKTLSIHDQATNQDISIAFSKNTLNKIPTVKIK